MAYFFRSAHFVPNAVITESFLSIEISKDALGNGVFCQKKAPEPFPGAFLHPFISHSVSHFSYSSSSMMTRFCSR